VCPKNPRRSVGMGVSAAFGPPAILGSVTRHIPLCPTSTAQSPPCSVRMPNRCRYGLVSSSSPRASNSADTTQLPRLFPLLANEDVGITHIRPPVLVGNARVRRHDVDHGQLVPHPKLIVVGIMRRRDLQKPPVANAAWPSSGSSLSGKPQVLPVRPLTRRQHDVVILDHRDHPPDNRQLDKKPPQRLRPRVLRRQPPPAVSPQVRSPAASSRRLTYACFFTSPRPARARWSG